MGKRKIGTKKRKNRSDGEAGPADISPLLHAVLFSYEKTLCSIYEDKSAMVIPYLLEQLEKALPSDLLDDIDGRASLEENFRLLSDYLAETRNFSSIEFVSNGNDNYSIEVNDCEFAKNGIHKQLKTSGIICPVALFCAAFVSKSLGESRYVAVASSKFDDLSSDTKINVRSGKTKCGANAPLGKTDLLDTPLDRLDVEVLKLMQINARMSNVDIAEALETSEATIRRRIQALMDRGIIRGFVTQIDHGKFSSRVRVHLAIDASLDKLDDVSKKLMSRSELCSLYRSIGQYNLICELLMDDMSAVQTFIDELNKTPGVNRTDSMITTAPIKPCPWYGQ